MTESCKHLEGPRSRACDDLESALTFVHKIRGMKQVLDRYRRVTWLSKSILQQYKELAGESILTDRCKAHWYIYR